jgi:hypothetical protein
MRATWLLGSTGTLFMVGGAFASSFTLTPVVDDSSSIEGSLTLQYVHQLVVGNGGLVALHTIASDQHHILKSVNGVTTILAAPTEDGYSEFREISISQGANLLTFEAVNASGNFALFQRSLGSGTPVRVDTAGTNTGVNESFSNNHYQVNDSGVAVYKHLTGPTQNFSTAIGTTTINTVSEGDVNNLKGFNLGTPDVAYRRQVVTQDGSVVFYAETADTNTPGIYRMGPTGSVSQVSLSGISTVSSVQGASNDAVLYTTLTTPGAGPTVHLNLKVGNSASIELTNYLASNDARPQTIAMTQQNRIAFYDPGSAPNSASLKYYDADHNVVTIAAEGISTVTDGSTQFTIKALSIDDGKRTAPMVNDNGIVVFDAVLTPELSSNDVHAYLAWDTQSETLKVIVKADLTGEFSDQLNGQTILAFLPDVSVNESTFANDVLKDALSDDNWFAFTAVYLDENEGEHIAVGMTHIPEPATVSAMVLIGAGALLRRRRAR